MRKKVLHIGAGSFGIRWCREFLPNNVASGHIEVVGLCDMDRSALKAGAELLNLSPDRCYIDMAEAFEKTKPDFCAIVIPPAYHEAAVDLAIKHGVHILSEKPISDTLEASIRIVEKVRKSGLKAAITMSHRFDQDKQTMYDLVRTGHLGKLNMLSCRVSTDFRKRDSWQVFRHNMADPLLIEGAVHHIDMLVSLAGSECVTVYADTWRPEWAEYAGDTDGVIVFSFANSVRAVYEGSVSAAVGVGDFYVERLRADGSNAVAIINNREMELFHRVEHRIRQQGTAGKGQKTALLQGTKWINSLLIEKFVIWLNGGPAMETTMDATLHSAVVMFAAIESSRTRQAVDVAAFLRRHGG
jgi:predicted dehydrogenase